MPTTIIAYPPKLVGVVPEPPIRRRSLILEAGANVTLTPTQTDGAITVSIAATGGSSGPATEIRESSGPTTLAVGAVANGQVLKRVGSTVVGAWLAVAMTLVSDGGEALDGGYLVPASAPTVVAAGAPV